MMGKHWVCSFAFAHADTVYMPWEEGQRTIVYTIENNLAGDQIRFRFSNRYGIHDGSIASVKIGKTRESMNSSVTAAGSEAFAVGAGESILTDPVDFSVRSGDLIWIRIDLTDDKRPESGYSLDGISVGYLEEMDVYMEEYPKVVAAFGDSITRMNTWTGPLQEELYSHYPGSVAFINKGISGNRLVQDCMKIHHNAFGVSGIRRFSYDVLDIPGLTHVIFALGTNDLGHPGEPDCPIEEQISIGQFTEAVVRMAKGVHDLGAVFYGATITGRVWNPPYWTDEKEELREKINEWIRHSGVFDFVLDFDEVTKREDHTMGMKAQFDSGDGLHPSAAGGEAIKRSILLEIFGVANGLSA